MKHEFAISANGFTLRRGSERGRGSRGCRFATKSPHWIVVVRISIVEPPNGVQELTDAQSSALSNRSRKNADPIGMNRRLLAFCVGCEVMVLGVMGESCNA